MNNVFHTDGTLPSDDRIFVFGSNLIGVHGAGAARKALEQFGAQWGKGIGLAGKSYAIPTKDETINTMEIEKIVPYIKAFVKFTKNHPELKFFVTRVGCGLAGYYDAQVAPFFKGAVNCSFPEEWKQYVE